MVQLAPQIVVDERVRFGKPVIEGIRVPLDVVLDKLVGGMSVEAVAEEYGRSFAVNPGSRDATSRPRNSVSR